VTRTFLRTAELSIARPAVDVRGGPFGAFFGQAPNGIKINSGDSKGLRIKFQIEKSLESNPNNSEIVVYNLAPDTRAALQAKGLHVRLQAGYEDGETVAILFSGDLRHCEHRKASVDWETHLSIGDGERAYRFGHVSRSFREGVTRHSAASEAAGAMGLQLPAGLESLLGDQFAAGLTMHGPAQKELSKLLEPKGLSWSVQDGRLQVLTETGTRKGTAIRIAPPNSGTPAAAVLVGVPEFGTPKKKGDPPTMTCKILLNADVYPGTRIQMDSAAIKGNFKVIKVTHTGDTAGGEWYSACEARPL